MAQATILGFARIGANRELKKATEAYWAGRASAEELLDAARGIRRRNWEIQTAAGLDSVPSGDFSLYDHVLDTAFLFDAVPERFRRLESSHELDLYFAMARGTASDRSITALEMTKWFDTNYHYLVPEFTGREEFWLARTTPVDVFREAAACGVRARPVVLGPVSFLLLGKAKAPGLSPLSLLDDLLFAYEDLFSRLAGEGAEWVQVDEPVLALDLAPEALAALESSLTRLSRAGKGMKILLASYFGPFGDNLAAALRWPIHALHLDLVRGAEDLDGAIRDAPRHLALSLGLVDGRNVWKTDLQRALKLAERAADRLSSERILVSPSCSLMHAPVDLSLERSLAPEIQDWLAFGKQKLDEAVILKRALNEGRNAVRAELDANAESIRRRRESPLVMREAVRRRLESIGAAGWERRKPFAARQPLQRARLGLPLLPTTTIGSFPQTAELRSLRARLRQGAITPDEYESRIRGEIREVIERQERLGLDVLVHGEPERNDMVEHFGELLDGFALTGNGWIQSYGSRCVKPPVIYGDVARRGPMTVDLWRYAQSLTSRPVKGMLTGPVTILQWSFVRDDQPRRDTCLQLALAIRDEARDLETAGCGIIQIDEPALREGLPLRQAGRPEYLRWAVDAFRLASSGVSDSTQIHTHMCYGEFGDIGGAIAAMDADVISLESARSQMDLLASLAVDLYAGQIGPGVYDIHSPRVPSAEEIAELLRKALRVISGQRLWVNPDCGLKTRRWEEALPALERMVAAARQLRAEIGDATTIPS